MTKTKESDENQGVINLSGPMSIYEIADIRKKLLRALENEATVKLDLGDVSFCDTAGIQLLYAAGKTGKEKGRRVIISKTSEAVQEAARLIGVEPDLSQGIHGG